MIKRLQEQSIAYMNVQMEHSFLTREKVRTNVVDIQEKQEGLT